MKKLLLLILVVLNWNSYSQGIPPPNACRSFEKIDIDNNGYSTFEIDYYLNYVRFYANNLGYNLTGYTLQMFPSEIDFYNNTNPITTPNYTNTILFQQACYIKFIYNGSGPFYSEATLNSNFSCQFLSSVPYNGDFDEDSIPNGMEDLNNNLILFDDNTDGDANQNSWDNDDDNDGILTINEDYNGNGSVLDDDMNGNGIVDYLDTSARGTLTLNLKLFIEGYYAGPGMMRSVKFNQDGISPLTDVENITVELHNAIAPFGLVTSATALLKTNGTVTCSFPTASVGSYFIVVKSANGIPTWSANPQTLSTTPLTYDFSTAANKAFGNNMKNLGSGVFGLFSGDINQDDFIDATDYSLWETDANTFAFGNKTTDCNGDGLIDPTDYSVWETNNNNFIAVSKPE